MPELILICGLMGCGKTYFAKEFAGRFGYRYINFDKEYHYKIQGEKDINSKILVSLFIEKISKLINMNSDTNFICDNWFKWHKDWWKDKKDNTLLELQKKLAFHEIKVFFMVIPFKKAYEKYVEKHKEAGTMIQENYKETMKERQLNLLRKISKWVTQ